MSIKIEFDDIEETHDEDLKTYKNIEIVNVNFSSDKGVYYIKRLDRLGYVFDKVSPHSWYFKKI